MPSTEELWSHYPEGVKLVIRAWESAQRNATYRTKQPFLLTHLDIDRLLVRSAGRCEVSGMLFSGDTVPGCDKRPFIPSIDRVRPKEPYSLDNCRLVCWAVNLAISDWGDGVFWKIVRSAQEMPYVSS